MLVTKQILQDNLAMLLATRADKSRLNLSRQMKVSDGTLGSIQYGKGNPTLEVLETIAKFFELELWQLLSPNLGQSTAISKAGIRSGNFGYWPFTEIKPADFDVLPGEEIDEIEHQIAYKVKRALKKKGARKKKV